MEPARRLLSTPCRCFLVSLYWFSTAPRVRQRRHGAEERFPSRCTCRYRGVRGRSCTARAPVCVRATAREMTREREGKWVRTWMEGPEGPRGRARAKKRCRTSEKGVARGGCEGGAFAEKVGPPFAPPRWYGQRGERWARLFDIRGPTPFAVLCSIRCAIYPDSRVSLSLRVSSSSQPRVDQISVTAVSFPENGEGRVSAQISISVQNG